MHKEMEEFLKLLKKIKPNVDFTKEQALVDDGLLESLDIISIISEVAEVYGVLIPSDEIRVSKGGSQFSFLIVRLHKASLFCSVVRK